MRTPLRVSGSYLLRRTIYAAFTLFAVVCINFALPRLVPGSPLEFFANPRVITTPSALEALKQRFGLDKSYYVQFWLYLENTLSVPPNFGVSYLYYPAPAFTVIMQYLPWTLFLVGISAIVASAVGTLIGIWSGSRPGSRVDTVAISISMVLWTMPFFWLGTILLWIFGLDLKLFPLTGVISGGLTASRHFQISDLGDIIWHAFLPMVTLVTTTYAGYSLVMRNTLVTELSQDYILLARAKGLRERTIVLRHAARNALLPIITLIGLRFGYVMGGALLVEVVFGYQGIGYLTYRAVLAHDFPLLQGVFFIVSVTVIIANYIADVLYSILDPRVKF